MPLVNLNETVYDRLQELKEERRGSFSKVITFLLDEYQGRKTTDTTTIQALILAEIRSMRQASWMAVDPRSGGEPPEGYEIITSPYYLATGAPKASPRWTEQEASPIADEYQLLQEYLQDKDSQIVS